MTPISFTISLCPKSTQSGNRIGYGWSGKAKIYSNKEKTDYQFLVKAGSRRYAPSTPLTGPIKMDLVFIMPRPAKLFTAKSPDGLIPMAKRPDRDNLTKGTQDGLSMAGFWVDDGQIYDGRIAKFYAEKKGDPRIIVTIEEVES